jgi:uncharacterized membrane protein
MLTIVLSWTFIHCIFALHYAHEFYGEKLARSQVCNFLATRSPITGASSISLS